jgi:glycerol uptake facilitator-like aquaporin
MQYEDSYNTDNYLTDSVLPPNQFNLENNNGYSIKRFDVDKYSNYISDDSYYHDDSNYGNTANYRNSPRVNNSIISDSVHDETDNYKINILQDKTNVITTSRYFDQIDFFYFCNLKKIKSIQIVFYLYLQNILKYGIFLNYADQLTSGNILPIFAISLTSLLIFSLFDKIKIVNPNIIFVLVLFKRKQIIKLIWLIVLQIVASSLSTITLYYMYNDIIDDISKMDVMISFSNISYGKTILFVIIYNIVNSFMFVKSKINNEFIYYILAEFILITLFVKYIYNIDNIIHDLTARTILSILYSNKLNQLIIPIISISAITGSIFGIIIYILLIDNVIGRNC